VLTHIVNTDDISISLSGENVNVSLNTLEELTETQNTLIQDVQTQLTDVISYIDDLEGNTYDTASACDDIYFELQRLNTQTETLTTNSFYGTLSSKPLYTTIVDVVTAVIPSTISVDIAQTNNLDSFGRLRTSSPFTLFDSSHRYSDNGLWSTLTANGSAIFNPSQGLVDLVINGGPGSTVIRETTKTFSYQPGKSLLIMNSFVLNLSATGLRQKVGYMNSTDGIYLQLQDEQIAFVRQSSSLGTTTIIPRSSWIDKLDGNGPSGATLDITKAQILWMDLEWLGVGAVRIGFIIDGKFITCYQFNHANNISTTYINTACLPLRYEISNISAPSGTYTIKQVCSTVLSEGGYELRGMQQSIHTPITTPIDLTLAGTYYPLVTLRLKSTRKDAIAILSNLSFLGITNNANYHWQLVGRGVTTGGSGVWQSVSNNSSVEYKLDTTTLTGGIVLASGYTTGSNQGSIPVNIPKQNLFQFQIERDSLNNNFYEFTVIAASNIAGADALIALDWEEITR
jgi:hypothetical protein